MLERIEMEAFQAFEIKLLYIRGRGLHDHLILVIMLQTVRIFTVSAVSWPPRGLDIGCFPRLRPKSPEQGCRVKGAGAHFHIVRLLNHTVLFRPVFV